MKTRDEHPPSSVIGSWGLKPLMDVVELACLGVPVSTAGNW
jgi:hypothetical protein